MASVRKLTDFIVLILRNTPKTLLKLFEIFEGSHFLFYKFSLGYSSQLQRFLNRLLLKWHKQMKMNHEFTGIDLLKMRTEPLEKPQRRYLELFKTNRADPDGGNRWEIF